MAVAAPAPPNCDNALRCEALRLLMPPFVYCSAASLASFLNPALVNIAPTPASAPPSGLAVEAVPTANPARPTPMVSIIFGPCCPIIDTAYSIALISPDATSAARAWKGDSSS